MEEEDEEEEGMTSAISGDHAWRVLLINVLASPWRLGAVVEAPLTPPRKPQGQAWAAVQRLR